MPSPTRSFLGALSSWHGIGPPNSEDLAGHHVLAITQTGGAILGNRPLSSDGIKPWLFADGNSVRRGLTPIKSALPRMKRLPDLGYWGYDVISIYAQKHLMGHVLKT